MTFRGLAMSWVALCCLQAGCDRSAPKVEDNVAGLPTATDNAGNQSPSDAQTNSSSKPLVSPANDVAPANAAPPGPQDTVAPRLTDQTELMNRSFVTLQPLITDEPMLLVEHLRKIDSALQDLVFAGQSNLMDERRFSELGLRLGKMKRDAGARLADSPKATAEQRKSGMLAQLVALSHMSGLRSVEAAKELERFASELASSGDPDLEHQSRVVLTGFELQSLQNGVQSDPSQLLQQIKGLFQRPEDRNFPELMVLQQAKQVLGQMGFTDAAELVHQTLITEFRQSPDPQLRGEAWLIETQKSQAYQNFVLAFRDLGRDRFDSAMAFAAVRDLLRQFPSMQTLEQLASTVPNIEYSGEIDLSRDMVELIDQARSEYPEGDAAVIEKSLAAHRARLGLLNQPLKLDGLVGFDGDGLDWSAYEGKVVLVDFWASWCRPCREELPVIRQVYEQYHADGFEVLSVNMDEDLAAAREFVQIEAFPWRSFHAVDSQALGFRSPFAKSMGITSIPFMLVLDRDGTVAAIHVRGDKLGLTVQALLP